MKQPRIREMQELDSREVATLCGQLGYPTTSEEIGKVFAEILKSGRHVVFVADVDKVVGWIHAVLFPTLGLGLQTELGGLVVDDAYRGQGIGTALIRAAEDWATKKGYCVIRFTSQMKRIDAHRFYESLGYQKTKQSFVFEKKLPVT